MGSPIIAQPLGLFDCCGVSDGAACAIVTTPEIAKGLGKKDVITVKALQLALSSGEEMGYDDWAATTSSRPPRPRPRPTRKRESRAPVRRSR